MDVGHLLSAERTLHGPILADGAGQGPSTGRTTRNAAPRNYLFVHDYETGASIAGLSSPRGNVYGGAASRWNAASAWRKPSIDTMWGPCPVGISTTFARRNRVAIASMIW